MNAIAKPIISKKNNNNSGVPKGGERCQTIITSDQYEQPPFNLNLKTNHCLSEQQNIVLMKEKERACFDLSKGDLGRANYQAPSHFCGRACKQ